MKFFNEIKAFLNSINASLINTTSPIFGANAYIVDNLPQMNPAVILQQSDFSQELINEYKNRSVRITTSKPTFYYFSSLSYAVFVFNPCFVCNKIYIADFNSTNDLKTIDVLMNKTDYYKDYLYKQPIKLLLDYYK